MAATNELEQLFDSAPDDYRNEVKSFKFDKSIYGHRTVKEALYKSHFGKCCYCESKFGHGYVSYGDVEHFRPKAYSMQDAGSAKIYPGYYWLTYDWDNLLFSCEPCNRTYKKNFFPLGVPANRATSHHEAIQEEEPLLINPATEDPGQFLSFREEYYYALGGNRRGEKTISVLMLNDRQGLVEKRRDKLAAIQYLSKVIVIAEQNPSLQKLQQISIAAKQTVENALKNQGEFSAMVRAWVRDENVVL